MHTIKIAQNRNKISQPCFYDERQGTAPGLLDTGLEVLCLAALTACRGAYATANCVPGRPSWAIMEPEAACRRGSIWCICEYKYINANSVCIAVLYSIIENYIAINDQTRTRTP